MAYRDHRADPEVTALEAILAAEPGLRVQLSQVRRAHDELLTVADRLGIDLASGEQEVVKLETGGWLRRLVGGEERLAEKRQEVARLEEELAPIKAELERLAGTEREIAAKLAEMPGARDALARLAETRADAIRASEGPLGDDLRALEATGQRETDTIERFDAILAAAERAELALGDLQNQHRTLRGQPSWATAAAGAILDTDFSMGPGGSGDLFAERAANAQRVSKHLPFVRDRLLELVGVLSGPLDPPLRVARARLEALCGAPEGPLDADSPLFARAEEAAADLSSIVTALGAARADAARRRDAVETQKQTLIASPGAQHGS